MPQTFCDAQIMLGHPNSIPRQIGSGVVVQDVFSGMTGTGLSDGDGILPDPYGNSNPIAALPWLQTPYTLNMDGVQFARFTENGRVYLGSSIPRDAKTELAGFYLTPRVAPLDCKIGSNASTVLDGGNTDLNFLAAAGTWGTLKSVTSDGGNGIQNSGADEFAAAHTLGNLPANRGFRARFQLTVFDKQTKLHGNRLVWGNTFALNFLHGKIARFERFITVTDTVNGLPVTTQKWAVVKELTGTKPIDARGGKYEVFVYRLAGRLVVFLNGEGFWFLDTTDAPDAEAYTAEGVKKARGREVSWPEAYLWTEASGARLMRFELAVVKWSAPDGTPYAGYVERIVPRQTELDPGAGAKGDCAGWKRGGTKTSIALSLTSGGVKYRLAMTAGEDGIDTPFIDKVTARYEPVYIHPSRPAIDLRGQARNVSVSLELGPDVQGSEATIELDRFMLDKFQPGWNTYVQMDNPVDIYLRRAGSAYSHVFSGVVMKPERTVDKNGQRIVKINCRDSLVNVEKVGDVFYTLVDEKCFPGDLLFAEQLKNSFSNGGYGGDGVPAPSYGGLYYADFFKELVKQFLGDEEAARINGNGDARRYLSRSHPPILSQSNDIGGWLEVAALSGEPIAAGGFLLEPPFGESGGDWFRQIAQKDRCVFFKGWPPGYEGDAPCIIYGRLNRILRATGLRLHILRDVKVSGDGQGLLDMVSAERRPERTFNRAKVWGPEEPGLAGLAPSLSTQEFNLANTNRHAAFRSRTKTILVRDPLAFLRGQAIGEGLIQLMEGVDLIWPTFQIDGGDERIGVGHLVRPSFTNPRQDDLSLEINEMTFRTENVGHNCAFTENSGALTTVVRPRPLNAVEARAVAHVLAGGGINQTTTDGVETEVLG